MEIVDCHVVRRNDNTGQCNFGNCVKYHLCGGTKYGWIYVTQLNMINNAPIQDMTILQFNLIQESPGKLSTSIKLKLLHKNN